MNEAEIDQPVPVKSRTEAVAKLRPWIEASSESAWLPVVGNEEPNVGESKFGGAAHLIEGEAAPSCRLCGRSLQLLVQLDLGSLASMTSITLGSGTLQLFYCVGQPLGVPDDGHPDCWAEGAWEPFASEAVLTRVLPPNVNLVVDHLYAREDFPPRPIVDWQQVSDLPDPEDHDTFGMATTWDLASRTMQVRCPAFAVDILVGIDEVPIEAIASARGGDKLGGFPMWAQGNEIPNCPTCNVAMRFVFQIDSNDNVPFMFGDVGVGHITQCTTHTDVVTFAWACQ